MQQTPQTRAIRGAVSALVLAAATLIWFAPVVSAGQNQHPALNLRRVRLTEEDGQLRGTLRYSLVVGTYYEWNTDPTAVPGLFSEITERTGIRARVDFSSVSLDSEELFANPFLIMTGNRFFSLADEEVDNMRAYLKAGGFLYADDCGGADHSFRFMIRRLFPDAELEEIPRDHPIHSSFYELSEVPKIVDLYGGRAKAFGVFLQDRLAVVYTYDTDVPCGWEKHPDGSFVHMLPPERHEKSIRYGVNAVMYALQSLHDGTNKQPDNEEDDSDEE